MGEHFLVDFDGKSYDLKRFLHDHPGGVNTLKHYKGRSVTDAMRKFGHSLNAYHMLIDFKLSANLKDSNLTGEVSANARIITKDEADKDAQQIAFLEELEGRLDWSQPLLSQLDKIAPHYELWVNTAVYRRCRLFSSPILERLTYTPWHVVPGFWIPVILYLCWTLLGQHVLCADTCTKESLTPLEFVYHLVFGICVWTILEYSLHRWVFHLDPGASVTWIKIHFLLHGLHHKTPFDGLRQVFPPVPAALIAIVMYFVLLQLWSHPLIKMTGGLAGYIIYDLIHFYVHHGTPAEGTYLYTMKRYHSNHHFINHDKGYIAYDLIHFYVHHGTPVEGTYLYTMKRYHSNHHFINHDKAFGISNTIWDHVFKTFVHVKKLSFSLRW